MEFLDSLWNMNQDFLIDDLRLQSERNRLERDLMAGELASMKQLAEENLELKLRLGLLLRLLIAKGFLTAEEFAAMIADARKSA